VAEDLRLDISILWATAQSLAEREAIRTGMNTGLNLAEYLLKNGVVDCPASVYMYLCQSMTKEVRYEQLRRGVTCWPLQDLVPDEIFVGTEFLTQAYQYRYMNSVLRAFDAVFEVRAALKVGAPLHKETLFADYLAEIRLYVADLN